MAVAPAAVVAVVAVVAAGDVAMARVVRSLGPQGLWKWLGQGRGSTPHAPLPLASSSSLRLASLLPWLSLLTAASVTPRWALPCQQQQVVVVAVVVVMLLLLPLLVLFPHTATAAFALVLVAEVGPWQGYDDNN